MKARHISLSLPRLFPLFLLLNLLLVAPAQAERLVTDQAGRQVRLPDEVRRVYAVGHCIPIVGALAPEKLLNNYALPAAAQRFLGPALTTGKATPLSGKTFSDEEIVRMAPDLVVMETGSAEQARRLEARLHLPVVLIDQNLAVLGKTFAFLGAVLGSEAQARRLSDFLNTYVEPVGAAARRIPAERRVRVYYAEGPDGLATNPAGSSHTQVLDFVGGINVAKVDLLPGEATNTINMEQLYLWQPDLILVWTPAADRLTTWRAIVTSPLWQRLRAVREKRVVQIPWLPYSWFDRPPGSNRILGVFWLAKRLYPADFNFDLVAVSREYFRLFYHREASSDEIRELLALADPSL